MINGKTVALSPVSVNFTNIVETGRVIVSGLEVLRLIELVRVSKLDLTELLLARSTTKSRHLGEVTSITCNEGNSAAHCNTTCQTDRGHSRDLLGMRHEVLLLSLKVHRLLSHGRLLDIVGLLMDNVAARSTRLGSHGSDSWLLKRSISGG